MARRRPWAILPGMAIASLPQLSPDSARRATGLAMLTATAFFFGGAMVAGKVAVAEVPPFTVAAARFAIAAALLFGLRLAWPSLDHGSARPRVRDLPIIAGLALSASAGYNILFLNGLRLAPATDASMIIPGLAPIVSTVLAAIVLRDRPTRAAVAGQALAAVGVLLVVDPSGSIDRDRLIGDALFVGCAVLFGSYFLISRVAGARFSPISVSLYGATGAAVILAPFAVAEGGPSALLDAGAGAWLAIGQLSVLATVAAFVLLNEGLRRLGVSRSAAFALMIPVFGTLSAVVVLGERVAGTAFIGAAVVLIGIWLVQGGRLPSLSRGTSEPRPRPRAVTQPA
jgi:drug/metabolite transporter (DMT)-like permease